MNLHSILIFAVSMMLTSPCLAQIVGEKKSGEAQTENNTHQSVITPVSVKWRPFIPGAEIAVMSGDPAKPGPFVIRIKHHAGLKVPPHWHPTDEHITIITGKAIFGMGEKFDPATGNELAAGSYVLAPKKMAHFIYAKEETISQVHGIGPFQVFWVNPADDPMKKATGK
jgi:quercetin dioxygenase-like cupin family protein